MIPVLLVTGFLGSGKTTLLNRMLERRPATASGRWAIIVNELGAVGVDGDLLPNDMTRQVELPNGCICCVLNEELDKTILELLKSAPDLEVLVIETTGVAEPMPIAWTLEDAALASAVRLAAVITVVDAVNHEQHRPSSPAVDAQVEYADVLAVTKLDVLGVAQPPRALVDSLRRRNGEAPILMGAPDQLADKLWELVADPSTVTSAGQLSGQLSGRSAAQTAAGQSKRAAGPSDSAAHGPNHHHVGALHGVQTISLPIHETLDFEDLAEELEELPEHYLRIKGIARVIDRSTGTDEPHFVAFHRVGSRVSREPVRGHPVGRIVALGTGLDDAVLAACVRASVVTCDAGEV